MPSTLEDLRSALSDRYRIERELGHGGMATVYLAEDLKHHRKVAMKVLQPELAAMLGAERFLREIQVTANLHYPNIVQLYDSGVVDGTMYYVMPYVEGESLRDRLDRDGALPVDEAVAIARTVAGALEFAHRHNVVHRDIKPANIMLQAGNALVADFGIALALDSASSERITMTGLSVGTPTYMSPEQASGDSVVRPTSDIYALGCVLYEMLTGDPPFTGSTTQAIVARVISEKPAKLRTKRESVPAHVEAAVDRALAKLPADRFQSAADFAAALGAPPVPAATAPTRPSVSSNVARIGAGVIAVAVLAWVLLARDRRASRDTTREPARVTYVEPADDRRPSIAVLSFVDMSAGHDQEYFSDGISEEILSVLSKIRELRVAARATAFTYKGRNLDLRQIGKELGVRYLLGGSVRKDGDQLRITSELVNAADGFRVWSQTYDRRLQNVFAIQSDIAERIAEALRVPLGITQQELVLPTADMTAHDLYLNGRAAIRRRGRGVAQAVRLFEAAVARDSTWAPAWAGLAEAWAMGPEYNGMIGESTDSAVWARSLQQAERAARRALALDRHNDAAWVALGTVHRDRWEWEEGEKELLQALEIDPDNPEAHTQYADLLWGMGRLDESMRESGRALALDRAPVRLDTHAFALYMNGRNREAEALLEEGIAMDTTGDVHYLRTVLGRQLLFEGRYKEALNRFAFYLGDTASYRVQGEALASKDPARLRTAKGVLAQTWMLLGDSERALDALQAEVFAMPFRVRYNIWDPLLAPIRDTRRFQEVILPHVRLRGRVAKYAGPEAGR